MSSYRPIVCVKVMVDRRHIQLHYNQQIKYRLLPKLRKPSYI